MLSILLNYGAELGLPGCLDLAQVLERMILRVPQTVKRAAEGLRRGTRRHRSVALGVAAQFELTTRQVDVIGYWERIDRTVGVEPDSIVDRGQVWPLDCASKTLQLVSSILKHRRRTPGLSTT
jgi:hypothetical protein